MKYAVITGGAGGLGKAFSFELAKRGYQPILIDLPDTGLKQICSSIDQEFGTESIFFETDLTKPENVIKTAEKILDQYSVSILINNVGLGGSGRYDEVAVDHINTIVQLNVMCTALMTRILLPNLKKQEKAYILNIASIASFSPIPFKSVYPASKMFVYSFSRGLNEELKKTGVFVSVVTPGPMRTNPEISARIDKQGWLGRVALMSPEQVAEKSINRLFKRDSMIVLNFPIALNWLLMKIIPIWLRLPLLSRTLSKELED